MDIPRGEIILESPLEFVDLRGVLGKFKDVGYLEVLLTEKGIEEGYIIIENGVIIGVFYEGNRKGDPLQNIQELLHENCAVILHKLTDSQMSVLKEVYPLDKKYDIGVLFEGGEVKKATPRKTKAAAPGHGKIMWEDEIPILTKGGQMTNIGREEFLENIDPFARSILQYVDGETTVGEIIKKSGHSPEDVLGVIEPYKLTGYIKFKK